MATVSTYLNFDGQTEEAFNFYKSIFGTEFNGDISRMGEVPRDPGMPELSEAEKNLIMHIELPITAGHLLMGTDILPSMGMQLTVGNNMSICLQVDDRQEVDRLYSRLSEGGESGTEPTEMFWGDYYTAFADKYGVRWMIITSAK